MVTQPYPNTPAKPGGNTNESSAQLRSFRAGLTHHCATLQHYAYGKLYLQCRGSGELQINGSRTAERSVAVLMQVSSCTDPIPETLSKGLGPPSTGDSACLMMPQHLGP